MLLRLKAIIETMDDHLQVFIYLLAFMAVSVGAFFVYTAHMTGTDWVLLTSALGGANSLGQGMTRLKGRETYWRPPSSHSDYDRGDARPQ